MTDQGLAKTCRLPKESQNIRELSRDRSIILSIVVPAFNVEQFVGRCLSSLGGSLRGVEIIVIDDASTDRTAQVIEAMANSGGFRVVSNQANGGLGAARNSGLEIARGDYVWFVDGDDYLREGSLQSIIQVLDSGDHDVVVVDFDCVDEGGNSIEWIACPFLPDHGKSFRGAEFFAKYFATTYAVLFIIRRELMERHGLRFQPRINMQDAELLPQILAKAESVLVSGVRAYYYVQRRGSFINSTDVGVRERYFASVVEVYSRLSEFRGKVDEPTMRTGLDAKLAAVEKIAFLSYVYDAIGPADRARRLAELRAQKLYPFGPLSGITFVQRLARHAINLFPLFFPSAFAWGRSCLRRVSGALN